MGYYEIVVACHIERKRLKDFAGMDEKLMKDGTAMLFGNLKDQSELFSVLNKIRDMNLILLSVRKVIVEKETILNNKGEK